MVAQPHHDRRSIMRSFLHTRLPYDCRELLRFIDEAEQMFGPLGFASVEDLVRRGGCLESRLGRKLKPKDFQRGDPFGLLPGTQRLLKRRGG
jgi:hypothetical protein